MVDVAVVGGGAAGSAAARALLDSGACASVTVLDWGRRAGGRCAHRRLWRDPVSGAETFAVPPSVAGAQSGAAAQFDFDHGVQVVQFSQAGAKSATVAALRSSGALRLWRPRTGWLLASGGGFVPTSAATSVEHGTGLFNVCDADAERPATMPDVSPSSRAGGVGGREGWVDG